MSIIVIDAGHGGKDSGAVGKQSYEKDINLKAALKLKELLLKLGHDVYMTRQGDTYMYLSDRANYANAKQAKLFISIHTNGATSKAASGFEVAHFPNSVKCKKLAEEIVKAVKENKAAVLRKSPVLPMNLAVLRETEMTAVLIELGFITNEEEEARLLDDLYLNNLLEVIAETIHFKS